MTDLQFEPLQFLKAHSKDAGDLSTQIWDCFFSKSGNELVTCGGNSICIIETSSFEYEKLSIKKYYAKDPREMFLTVTETQIGDEWIVIAAGARSELHLIDAKRSVTFKSEFIGKKTGGRPKQGAVNNLLVHPDNPSIVICSTNSGVVLVVDIGIPTYPTYVSTVTTVQEFTLGSEIFATIYEPETQLFLCATNKGLVGFTKQFEVLFFKLPTIAWGDDPSDEEELVDSVQNICNGYISVKCALHGRIYVCSLNEVTKDKVRTTLNSSHKTIKLKPSLTLRWSDTDNYFMSIGYNQYCNLLYCGDDEGCIWMYSLPPLLKNELNKEMDPTQILTWPEVMDRHAEASKKINLEAYDIVINKVVMHPRGQYLISVTSNNYVCIWRNENLMNM